MEGGAARGLSLGATVGFGFIGLIFGSFAGWCTGLLSRMSGPNLFKYMMLGALIGAAVGVVAGALFNHYASKDRGTSAGA